eukprot:6754457-Lingulodinium_polyedra.AAC.1
MAAGCARPPPLPPATKSECPPQDRVTGSANWKVAWPLSRSDGVASTIAKRLGQRVMQLRGGWA